MLTAALAGDTVAATLTCLRGHADEGGCQTTPWRPPHHLLLGASKVGITSPGEPHAVLHLGYCQPKNLKLLFQQPLTMLRDRESQGRAAAAAGSPDVPPALLKAQAGLWVRSPKLFLSLRAKSGPQPRSPMAGGLLVNPTLTGAVAGISSASSPPYCSATLISKTHC